MNETGEAGRVILAGTPLGNVRDASLRLIDALATAAVIAAEDTRRVRRLCADLGVAPQGRIVSFFDGNEQHRVPELLDALRDGHDVLVVTDAGMPSISDPGYRLVAAAVGQRIAVTTAARPVSGNGCAGRLRTTCTSVLLRRIPAAQSGRSAAAARLVGR